MIELKTIYDRALQACAPDVLVRRVLRDDFPRSVVAIGKCAGALLDGFGEFDDAFVAIPKGYPKPHSNAIVFEGGHPEMTAESFVAGKALLDFVDAHDAITFLVSGGGSACVEWPLAPFTRQQVIELNARLIRSGLSIHDINIERKRVSAIKGGRLAARLKRSVTLVYSDVSSGAVSDVASGPSIDGEVHLIADNRTLVDAAATIAQQNGFAPVTWNGQIESDVQEAATAIANAASKLGRGEMLIAGGEPTVVLRGGGRGGRCSELAVRCALEWDRGRTATALFGSSDGVDGNSGAAAVMIDLPATIDRAFAEGELARSNAMAVVERIGRAIPLCPTGNNLRDVYLLACS